MKEPLSILEIRKLIARTKMYYLRHKTRGDWWVPFGHPDIETAFSNPREYFTIDIGPDRLRATPEGREEMSNIHKEWHSKNPGWEEKERIEKEIQCYSGDDDEDYDEDDSNFYERPYPRLMYRLNHFTKGEWWVPHGHPDIAFAFENTRQYANIDYGDEAKWLLSTPEGKAHMEGMYEEWELQHPGWAAEARAYARNKRLKNGGETGDSLLSTAKDRPVYDIKYYKEDEPFPRLMMRVEDLRKTEWWFPLGHPKLYKALEDKTGKYTSITFGSAHLTSTPEGKKQMEDMYKRWEKNHDKDWEVQAREYIKKHLTKKKKRGAS